jgi:hypothetical protein
MVIVGQFSILHTFLLRSTIIVLLSILAAPSRAQVVAVQSCSGADANVTSTTAMVVLSGCSVTAGPKGIVFATAQAETVCGTTATEGVQMLIGTTQPTVGSPPPGGMTAMTPLLHQNGCNTQLIQTSVSGVFIGTPGSQYWIAVTLSTSSGAQAATWNNQTVKVITY